MSDYADEPKVEMWFAIADAIGEARIADEQEVEDELQAILNAIEFDGYGVDVEGDSQ